MASIFRLFFINLLLSSVIVFLSLPNSVHGIPEQELQDMVLALRARGYNLFSNAIMTSDIHQEILAGRSFTVFAPTDSALFALDMTATASDYIKNLRCHIVIHRFSIANFRSHRSGSFLRTVFPRYNIQISGKQSSESYIFTANGVDIVAPGLFNGRDIVVHGLGGILNHQSTIGTVHAPPPEQFSSNEGLPPSLNDLDEFKRLSPGSETNLDEISPVLPPGSEHPLDGIFQGSSPESQDDSNVDQTMAPKSPGFPAEYGVSVKFTVPTCNDDFCPAKTESLIPAESQENSFPPDHSLSPDSDSDGYLGPMPPTLQDSEVFPQMTGESKAETPSEIGISGENPVTEPMSSLTKELLGFETPAPEPMSSLTQELLGFDIPETAPAFSWPLNAETVEGLITADGKELSTLSIRRDNPDTVQHYSTGYFK